MTIFVLYIVLYIVKLYKFTRDRESIIHTIHNSRIINHCKSIIVNPRLSRHVSCHSPCFPSVCSIITLGDNLSTPDASFDVAFSLILDEKTRMSYHLFRTIFNMHPSFIYVARLNN